jgi:hypothetical protein
LRNAQKRRHYAAYAQERQAVFSAVTFETYGAMGKGTLANIQELAKEYALRQPNFSQASRYFTQFAKQLLSTTLMKGNFRCLERGHGFTLDLLAVCESAGIPQRSRGSRSSRRMVSSQLRVQRNPSNPGDQIPSSQDEQSPSSQQDQQSPSGHQDQQSPSIQLDQSGSEEISEQVECSGESVSVASTCGPE